MKLAEVLSDLATLQVCDVHAALALVNARPDASTNGDYLKQSTSKDDSDIDLKRAKDLLELHSTVKLAHQDGMDRELNAARDAVAKVLRTI